MGTLSVILDDVTPARGTIVAIGTPATVIQETGRLNNDGIRPDRGQIMCTWVGDEPPTKGGRAWHRGDGGTASF